jgi:hypothetical protein
MFEPNVQRVLDLLSPDDVVLDIGGWASPFNRANYILDASPYETRGFYRTWGGKPYQGGDVEHFTRDTWIQRDICAHEPYPFADKSIDFVICSHVLEDIRDPLWVCAEMVRIAKRGYIEVPSRIFETCRGVEHPDMAGLSHHRWLIEIVGDSIEFRQKPHSMHTSFRYSLPRSFARRMPDERMVQWLFWEDAFTFSEEIVHGLDAQHAELMAFVERVRPYHPARIGLASLAQRAGRLGWRVRSKLERMMPPAKMPVEELDRRLAEPRAVPSELAAEQGLVVRL